MPGLKAWRWGSQSIYQHKGNEQRRFSQEFLDFMKYVTKTTDAAADATESSRIKLIHKQVKGIKLSEKMGGNICSAGKKWRMPHRRE